MGTPGARVLSKIKLIDRYTSETEVSSDLHEINC